jgi:hypothetical protein
MMWTRIFLRIWPFLTRAVAFRQKRSLDTLISGSSPLPDVSQYKMYLKSCFFWAITPCSLVKVIQCFGQTCVHLENWRISQARLCLLPASFWFCAWLFSTSKMQVTCSSEKLVDSLNCTALYSRTQSSSGPLLWEPKSYIKCFFLWLMFTGKNRCHTCTLGLGVQSPTCGLPVYLRKQGKSNY